MFSCASKLLQIFCFMVMFHAQKWCKACVLLEGLNKGLPKLGIGRSRGLDNNHRKDVKQSNGTNNIEGKQCGSLDFWCSCFIWVLGISCNWFMVSTESHWIEYTWKVISWREMHILDARDRYGYWNWFDIWGYSGEITFAFEGTSLDC